jgi:hypothetical protein
MIDCLKDKRSSLDGLLVLESYLHLLKSISKALNTDTNGSVSLVGVFCLFDWVLVAVDDLVEVSS